MADFTVTPIGTCRIHTPLRSTAARYPIKLQLGRNYGFVHTSTEALQQARFMYDQCDIPADIQRLIFRPSSVGKARSATHKPASLYMVEISSRKLLTLDGHPIQSNYLSRHFSELFADHGRSKMFWALAIAEKLAERRALLDQEPAFNSLPVQDRELLARILKRDLSDEEIEAEMRQIAELLGKDKVVFVTHIDALTADNAPIESRQHLIRTVTEAAARIGVASYDPTPSMNRLGQADAMEEGGLDLTHYTDRFSNRLGAEWFKTYMRPQMSASLPAPIAANLAAEEDADRIERAWESGELREASQRVRDVLRRHPGLPEHVVLLARLQSELGAYEEAISLLESADAVMATGSKAEQILMRSHYKLGHYELAYSLSSDLLGDESESPEIVGVAAACAAQLGYSNEALSNWKRLFRISSPNQASALEAADTVLSMLQAGGDMEAVLRWVNEVRATLPSHGRGFAVLWRDKLMANDRTGLRSLASESPELADADALELVQEASWRGCTAAAAAAALATSSGLVNSEQEDIRSWLQTQSQAWASEGAQALEEGRLRDAAERISAYRMLDLDTLSGARAQRAFERAIRLAVRAALLAGNHKEVIELTDIALDAHVDFPELDTMRGRAADALGDSRTAMRHLGRAVSDESAQFSTKLYFARVAFNGGWFGEAIDAYKAVLAHPSADQNAKEEAERQLGRLGPRSIRAARQTLNDGDYRAAWDLLDRVAQSWPQMPEVAHEKRRILGVLYAKVRALEPSSTSERLAVGEKILELVSDDVIGLRTAAVGAMRLHLFERALPYWQLLKQGSNKPEQFDNYIQRCEVWIERANRRRAA